MLYPTTLSATRCHATNRGAQRPMQDLRILTWMRLGGSWWHTWHELGGTNPEITKIVVLTGWWVHPEVQDLTSSLLGGHCSFFLYLVNGYDSEGSQHKSWTKPWNCHVIARLSGNLIGRMTVITEPIQKCLPRVLLWVLPWPQTWTLLARPPHMGLGGKYGIWFVWEILANERVLFWYAVVKIFLFSNTGKLYRYISRAFIVNWPGRSHCDATAKGIGMWGPRSGDPFCEDPVGSIQEDGGKPKEFQEGKAGWDLRAFDELVFPFKTIVWTVNNDLKFFFWAATAFL